MTISQLQSKPGPWIVNAEGRLDQSQTPLLEQTLDQLIADQHIHIIVDLSHTTYINSGGLRILLTGRRRSREAGGDLVVCCLNPRLIEIFETVGFDQVLPIYDSRANALEHHFD